MASKKQMEQWKTMIQKYTSRFNKAKNAVLPKHRIWTELDQFDRGEQWKDLNIPPWVPKPVTNYIRYIRTHKRANLASIIPEARFTAVYQEDEEIINRIQKAYKHVWDTERVSRKIRRAIDRALLHGTAIMYIYTDTTEVMGRYFGEGDPRNQLYQGRIKVEQWPITNFFPDPDADRLDKCKWIETTEVVPLSWVKENPEFRRFCEENGVLKKLDALSTDLLEREDSVSGTIFKRDTKVTENSPPIEGDEMVTLHRHWERYFKDGKWRLDVTYYLPGLDFPLLRVEDLKPNEYPFAVLYDEEEDGEFWGTSICMDVLENQKIINKLQQTASIIGVLHQNPQKIVYRESGINAQELARTGTLPGKVWTSNIPPQQAIHILEPMDIPRGLFELEARTAASIREIIGINEAYTGESVGSLTTSTGVSELIERATIRDRDKAIQIDEFVERISHLIAKNIIIHWQDERPITIQGPNGQVEYDTWTPIDEALAENLEWRVKSNVYVKAPLTQAARRQQADKLMQMQGQFQFDPPIITPEEWVKMQELDDEQEILQRMERDRQRIAQEKASNLAQFMVQVAQLIQQELAKGQPLPQVLQQAEEVARLMLEQQNQQDRRNGINPQATPATPRGVTGELQMANMARGI